LVINVIILAIGHVRQYTIPCNVFQKIETIYVLKTPADEPNSLEIQIFDGTQNPCRVKETWNENKWDAAITAIALFDYYANFVLSEKGITFTASMYIKYFIQTYKI
jgi:hypothetical protein